MSELSIRLKEFMENEARSCSMDFGCITPIYVYRMWGGNVAIEAIETALADIKNGTSSTDEAPFMGLNTVS